MVWALATLIVVLTRSAAMAGSLEEKASESPTGDEPALTESSDPFDPFDKGGGDVFENEDEASQAVADPIEGFNRAMFTVNDKLYFWVLKPVATGYRYVLPTPVRSSVKNFFYNLLGPVRFVNCLFQGKWRAAEGEFCRFTVNTTAGMLGFFDPAKDNPKMNPHEEDFGQTLGYYAVGNGCYIVWPIFGPSTLRDTVGAVGDWALNPFSFMKLINVDAGALTSDTTNVAMYCIRTVNDVSFRIGDYETLKNAALDPYEAFRNAYIQNRNSKIAR